ncbi:MAG: formyltransferase family protein [Paracoccaceae bacterium]|nr:formyltransferase family protein [Paracoccaceae bacterium]
MRLIVNGQQAFGRAALEAILEAGKDEVVGVYTAPDKEGRPADPIKECALEHGLPLFQPPNYKDPAVLDEMRSLNADLMVMAYMIIFVPEEARNIPSNGSICFHPSLLPLHRGPSSINWPIIWGSAKTGLSWFFPDDGLDEGDILLQREVEIGPEDTLGDVYFKKIFPLGVATTLEAIDLIRSGNPPHTAQDESRATYESWCRKKDVKIDWASPATDVYNMIRGANPQPGAWTTLNADEVQLYDSRRTEGGGDAPDAEPGEVVSVSEGGVTVQSGGGRILLKSVRPAGGGKVPAAEWASASGVSAGTKLGS